MKIFQILTATLLISLTNSAFAQSNKELAKQKAMEGIALEDEKGKYDDAIKLFEEAQKLDPENIDYPYETALAYIGKEEYEKSTEILEKLLKHKNVNDRVYQALGNAYDYKSNPEKAIETYEKGLKKFPNSGGLYLELGNMQMSKKQYEKALEYYEKGIEMEPSFSSNYYWASKLFCSSEEEVWGVIYGELFMNLERNSKRTAEISKLLLDTYKKSITFTSDTSMEVSFSQGIIDVNNFKNPKKIKLPFGTGCYEMLILMGLINEKSIDINSMDRIRTNFLENYFSKDDYKKYPNILFDFQKIIKESGHFEAYNHWLLMKGDEEAFGKWQSLNKIKWDNFTEWFTKNKISLDSRNKFYRLQY